MDVLIDVIFRNFVIFFTLTNIFGIRNKKYGMPFRKKAINKFG